MLCPFPYRVPIRKIGHMHLSARFPFAGCIQYLPRSAGWVADTCDQMGAVPQHILIGTHNGQLFKDAFHLPRYYTNHDLQHAEYQEPESRHCVHSENMRWLGNQCSRFFR